MFEFVKLVVGLLSHPLSQVSSVWMQMLHETYHCNAFVRSCHLDKAGDERLIIPALQKSMVWCVSHYFLSIREDPCLSRGRYGKCLGVYMCVCPPGMKLEMGRQARVSLLLPEHWLPVGNRTSQCRRRTWDPDESQGDHSDQSDQLSVNDVKKSQSDAKLCRGDGMWSAHLI